MAARSQGPRWRKGSHCRTSSHKRHGSSAFRTAATARSGPGRDPVKLTDRQHDVLTRMAQGGVLFVRFEPGEAGVQETCWIGTVELLPMTVNALIAARLIQRDKTFRTAGRLTASYVVSSAGQAALSGS